jgi:mannose-6-phosphate isomerase
VHPDDAYAAEHENGSLGKTEMWYVVDAKPDTKLVCGFSRNMTERLVRQSLEKGNIERYLQKVPVRRDDVFVIRPGTLHGIGAGALVAEIQESSNVTYRVYDYDRLDKNGKKRELHIEKALQVADLKSALVPRQPIRTLRYRPGWASELLYRCRYFQVERILINTERVRCMADFCADDKSFQIWLCVDGCGVVFEDDRAPEGRCACGQQKAEGQALRIFRGDCMFVPASSIQLKLHGKAQFLRVTC